ncbi:MurR/RpiR family transcriptional regulator [Staphylococcus sp. 17KM0847]|uniref:MurR/RpiR family transcriptional regulator n=1 Tax=Staphylococcus sp. 17KM0847 TaxID=2583989 RepID=UPI0015DCA068|nr:MurR/RpiR family transcriptional regulator [Staphylococcus sp. 17KM0847]QLK85362.1 MurR/RpiR family transcriptional regulator [Staphylococcus sp. 17KM0847]
MKVENRIQKARHQFTKNDRKIAAYLSNLHDASDVGAIHTIANDVGVSSSSVTRFVYKLGYDSFQSFRFAVQHELHSEHIDNSPSIQTMYEHYMSILNHTGEFIAENDLNFLVSKIQQSEKIIFIGIGSSGLTAQELYFRTARMGLNTIAITDAHLMAVVGHMCNTQTTVIALTNSGSTQEIIKSITHGRANGATVIAISNFRTDTLAEHCTRIIITADRRSTHDPYFINSQLANHFIIDLLSYHLLQDSQCLSHYTESYEQLLNYRENDTSF